MKEFTKIGTEQLVLLVVAAIIMTVVPIVIAIVWTVKKKEKFTTVLVGAVTFVLFALIIEKTIQNVLLFPTQMLLPDHAVSRFVNSRPLLLALLVGLFPGIFEETGRLVAFKTVLKKRKNRETSISYGIGHGGIEVILLLGLSYVTYFAYAIMINTGAFDVLIKQVAAQAPDQVDALYTLGDQIASLSLGAMAVAALERVSAVLFHIGASILVFYACRDKQKVWLYPLAILIHTAMDFIAGLVMVKAFELPVWALETVFGVFGVATFFGAYFLLYKKDKQNI